jgi:beta-fructofuranosidase
MEALPEHPQSLRAAAGWFALESYPADTAAFFGLRDTEERTVAVCVDRFGKLLLGLGNDGHYTYLPTKVHLEKFHWLRLLLADDPKGLSLYADGKKAGTVTEKLSPIQSLILAKDYRNKYVGRIFETTAINGIVSDIRLYMQPVDRKNERAALKHYGKLTPVLAIPAARFAGDFNRPKYHLLPAANWTNEIHGLLLYKGIYHIFNQENASNLFLGQINWGHFSSPDLVNWTEQRPAITPEPGYDCNGAWSGHAVINKKGIPTLIYTTGGARMRVGLAFPADSSLIRWKKYKGNPVILGQPKGFTRTDQRDEYAWREGNTWYLAQGYGITGDGDKPDRGTILLYKSPDLKHWTFLHTLFEGNPAIDHSGVFWEMPIFFKLQGKYVLLVNKTPQRRSPARAFYWVGSFKNERFVPDNPIPRNLEVINRLLSPSIAFDKEGRLVAMAIIPDEISSRAAYKAGWTHLYSIPRIWELHDGKICQRPYPALQQLRDKHFSFPAQTAADSLPFHAGSHQLEVDLTLNPGNARHFGFYLCKNADGTEYTHIYYDADKHEMVVDQTHATLRKDIFHWAQKDSYDLPANKPVRLHLFIDGSVVEVFINERDAFTTRIFPSKADSNQIGLFSEGGTLRLEKADVWTLRPADMKTNF